MKYEMKPDAISTFIKNIYHSFYYMKRYTNNNGISLDKFKRSFEHIVFQKYVKLGKNWRH